VRAVLDLVAGGFFRGERDRGGLGAVIVGGIVAGRAGRFGGLRRRWLEAYGVRWQLEEFLLYVAERSLGELVDAVYYVVDEALITIAMLSTSVKVRDWQSTNHWRVAEVLCQENGVGVGCCHRWTTI
jgi:hypothetical protein